MVDWYTHLFYVDLIGISGILCFLLFWPWSRRFRATLPLPPGPKPLPILGNMFDMPGVDQARAFQQWTQYYGDIIYLHLPGRPTLVLNTLKSAVDLLERRSNKYCSRPRSIMIELMSWSYAFGMMEYGQRWRSRRKYFHECFHQGIVQRYMPIQTQEIGSFLRRILVSDSTEKIEQHVLLTVYGIKVQDLNADYVVMARESLDGFALAGEPGAFWVEYLPILQFIPSWVPGAHFKRVVEKYRPFVQQALRQPFQVVKDSIVLNLENSPMCATRDLILYIQHKYGGSESYSEQEQAVMEAMGVAYGAATDTTNSVGSCFLLAMAKYPEVQKKAQMALDLHVGPHRLPTIEDYASLPYIRAIVMESIRWQSTFPLGLPRLLVTDDEYKGYRIPKGTTVLPNIWAILRDPEAYPSPEIFNPDRFLKDGALNPDIQDPQTIAFGFGRRICPGRHFSNNTLFLFIASVLHVFDIVPNTDDAGNPIPIDVDMTSGLLSIPKAVPCTLKPRSPAAEALILQSQ